jgi:hypothetical protein
MYQPSSGGTSLHLSEWCLKPFAWKSWSPIIHYSTIQQRVDRQMMNWKINKECQIRHKSASNHSHTHSKALWDMLQKWSTLARPSSLAPTKFSPLGFAYLEFFWPRLFFSYWAIICLCHFNSCIWNPHSSTLKIHCFPVVSCPSAEELNNGSKFNTPYKEPSNKI